MLTSSLCWAPISPQYLLLPTYCILTVIPITLKQPFTVLELLASQQILSLPSSLDAPVMPHLHILLAPADFLLYFISSLFFYFLLFLPGWKHDQIKFSHLGLKKWPILYICLNFSLAANWTLGARRPEVCSEVQLPHKSMQNWFFITVSATERKPNYFNA